MRNFFQNYKRTVTSTEMLPENKTGGQKVIINGDPFYWERYMWVKDCQARKGEYDAAPTCSDPENLDFLC